ncbi:MAG TPA: cysteine--tRNA ligase [Bacillota bacterium]|nr:cysteine--tRNA ligase [Bacillota bacterium]
MMKIYNTLTRRIEALQPQNTPLVTIYTCGPTVYDYSHVGHWFTYVRWDLLVRTLKASDLQPKWVMNITDVGHLVSDADEGEDKLEKGAKREGKTAWEVAKFYTDDFIRGMQELNMLMPNELPRATDHITEQINLIQQLEAKGFTYIVDDGVYYDTSKFPAYADFAKLDLEELQAGARVELNTQKRNPADFALWKFSPKDRTRDMEWDSPWGKGFPGWHIECSAMSMKYLGDTLDIHAGGIDHIPVHHTNEIAQSEPVTGKPFSNLWMHSNHVLVNGDKISKSLGNGIRLDELAEKGFSPQVVRLHILESHYRSQSKFSYDSLEAAKNRLQALQAMADLRWQIREAGDEYAGPDYTEYQRTMLAALQNDLDTPKALAALSGAEAGSSNPIVDFDGTAQEFRDFLQFVDDALGLSLLTSKDITPEQKQLIADREQARTAKDWARSDQLRDQLASAGIAVRDTPFGSVWSRA